MRNFRSRFVYRPEFSLYLGVERECFLLNNQGVISPIAPQVIKHLKDHGVASTYELSACQLETTVGPCPDLEHLAIDLRKQDEKISSLEEGVFGRSHYEVAPADMNLEVYPDETGCYQRIVKDMPRHILSAACRVIGTHVHVGMPDHESALQVYNYAVGHYGELCRIGNGSFGERLDLYKVMAPDHVPEYYASWEHFAEVAKQKGFIEDPRKCWTLIRISTHGTIEFRMFGGTSSIERIVKWASYCQEICSKALK